MKRNIIWVVVVLVVAVLAYFAGKYPCCEKSKCEKVTVTFPGAEKHEVPLADAIKFVQNYRKLNPKSKVQGGAFQRAIIDKILAQPDCDGVRYYYAQLPDSSYTIVLVGITAKGVDLTGGAIAEMSHPCPPWCDMTSNLK
jgi:hypothetical protein